MGEVYEFVLESLYYLREKASAIEVERRSIEDYWVAADFGGVVEGSVVGVDGGRNWVECRRFVLYVVNAEAVIFENGEEGEPVKRFDVDILYPHRHVEDRIASYSEILEGKAAYVALHDRGADLTFMDGSLIGVLIRPPFRGYTPLGGEIESYVRELVGSWKDVLEEEVFSKRMLKDVVNVYREMGGAAASFIENAEKLLVYKKLIDDYKDKVVFVSKTSRGCDYFRSFRPDISIFSEFTRGAGYSRPLCLEISNKVKWRFPIFNEYFKGLKVAMFYARLAEGGPVLRFELPGVVDESRVNEVLSRAASYSVAGYPYPLRKVHKEVKVSDNEAERLFRILGFYEGERGREFLEW